MPAESSTARPQRASSAVDARRERAVGRDEGRGPCGMGDGFAQRDRDGEGLLALVHGLHDGKALAAAPAQRDAILG